MTTSFVPPDAGRSYLDDIDGDDEPRRMELAEVEEKTNEELPSTGADATAAPSPDASPSGLDDIDDDTPAPSASHAPSSSPTRASPTTDTPVVSEVNRILSVLTKDQEVAQLFATPNGATPAAGVPTPTAQPDHFSVLNLAQPQVTVTGEGVWTVPDEDLKRAFKKLVLLIHPDKNPAVGAKEAFEAVKLAHSILGSEADRYDYVKAYTQFRRNLAQRSPDFLPPSVVSASLDDTLAAGRQVQAAKKKQSDSFAARLQAQAEAKRQSVLAGDAERRRKDEQRRQEELKRKVMESESDDGSDEDHTMSIAEKIRREKQAKGKKIRLL